MRDEDVQRVLHREIARGVEAVPLAPLAGRALRVVVSEDRLPDLFDAVIRAVSRWLEEHEAALRAQFGQRSPWWLPGALEDRIFDRALAGLRTLAAEVERDPNHALRAQATTWVSEIIERLETSPELLERGEALKRDLLSHPQVREWSASVWSEAKRVLRAQAADPRSELRRRLAHLIVSTGQRVRDDPVLAARADEAVEAAVRYLAEHFHEEAGELVTGTIARWDPRETSDKLELLLGPDLQFIRINGTVVGGLAGLVIHAVANALG